MPMTPNGLLRLQRDEGASLMPYRDSRGYLTIGVGRCIDTDGISYDECMLMLSNDLKQIEKDCSTLLFFPLLTDVRKDVIMMMRFNLGLAGLLSFKKMIAAIELENWIEAGNEMTNSAAAKETGQRYNRMANAIICDSWSPLTWDKYQSDHGPFPWNAV